MENASVREENVAGEVSAPQSPLRSAMLFGALLLGNVALALGPEEQVFFLIQPID